MIAGYAQAELSTIGQRRGRLVNSGLEAALDGRMREPQCFLLGMQLRSLGTSIRA